MHVEWSISLRLCSTGMCNAARQVTPGFGIIAAENYSCCWDRASDGEESCSSASEKDGEDPLSEEASDQEDGLMDEGMAGGGPQQDSSDELWRYWEGICQGWSSVSPGRSSVVVVRTRDEHCKVDMERNSGMG